MRKKRILCFGDSNTRGVNPTGPRFDEDVRWPMRLQSLLGDGFRVLEEGLGGRTIALDDPVEGGYRSGMQYLPPCLRSHDPLDLVIIMLGTNDTKRRFALCAADIAEALAHMVHLCRFYAADGLGEPSRLLIIAPPPVRPEVMQSPMAGTFGMGSVEVSGQLAEAYRRVADALRCAYLDAAAHCCASEADGVHLTAAGHLALAHAVADKVLEIFKEE